jgi:hypothetical protein
MVNRHILSARASQYFLHRTITNSQHVPGLACNILIYGIIPRRHRQKKYYLILPNIITPSGSFCKGRKHL